MSETDPAKAAIAVLRDNGVIREGVDDEELADAVLAALDAAEAAMGLASQCDEPGCTAQASCGYPTAAGYRRTCGKHANWSQAIAPK